MVGGLGLMVGGLGPVAGGGRRVRARGAQSYSDSHLSLPSGDTRPTRAYSASDTGYSASDTAYSASDITYSAADTASGGVGSSSQCAQYATSYASSRSTALHSLNSATSSQPFSRSPNPNPNLTPAGAGRNTLTSSQALPNSSSGVSWIRSILPTGSQKTDNANPNPNPTPNPNRAPPNRVSVGGGLEGEIATPAQKVLDRYKSHR